MRSSREHVLAALLAACVVACGTDPVAGDGHQGGGGDTIVPVDPDTCATSYLTYENFGDPFVASWCRGCHSSEVPVGMRQKAPDDVNFDEVGDVRTWGAQISAKVTGAEPSMPPAGGPSDDERALLAEWIACGAR